MRSRHTRGFSLVEMLIVIAVIGVIAAVAVPSIGQISQNANYTRNQRNAQNLVSVYTAALSAGHNFGTNLTTKGDIADAVVLGAIVTQGAFIDTYFGCPELKGEALTSALNHIEFEDGVLKYFEDAQP